MWREYWDYLSPWEKKYLRVICLVFGLIAVFILSIPFWIF